MMCKMKNIFLKILVITLLGCTGNESEMNKGFNLMHIKDVPDVAWNKLSNKRIFFGHQSVGEDIIQGIQEIIQEYPKININMFNYQNLTNFDQPFFVERAIGVNEKPYTKNNAFISSFEGDLKGKVDIAFFKYCYVDFNAASDINKIFNNYVEAVTKVKEKNSDMLIVHFTVPLTTNQTGVKAWIKQILGREIGGVKENIVRNRYNEMVLEKYSGTDIVFDLAKLESTDPYGNREKFEHDNDTYYSMVPLYTYDGGHLNKYGRRYIAEQLLITLANQFQ